MGEGMWPAAYHIHKAPHVPSSAEAQTREGPGGLQEPCTNLLKYKSCLSRDFPLSTRIVSLASRTSPIISAQRILLNEY